MLNPSKLLLATLCLVSVVMGNMQKKRKDPFDHFFFKPESEKQEIRKKCYQIMSNWREKFELDPKLSEIIQKDYHDWDFFEKVKIVYHNLTYNELYYSECKDVDFDNIERYGRDIAKKAENITPEELKVEEKKKMTKLAKFGYTILAGALFPVYALAVFGG